MTPVVLHVVRPYSSEDEYLAAEAWTIEARGMLLIGQREVEIDRSVVFDVALGDGTKIIRAEGRAMGFQPSTEDHPGGLRIRFRRFGAQTKAFIDRALIAREQTLAASMSSRPPPARPEPARSEPMAAAVEAPHTPVNAAFGQPVAEPLERSGVHRRPQGPVETPVNRDELLFRLRQRIAKASPRIEHAASDGERSAENG